MNQKDLQKLLTAVTEMESAMFNVSFLADELQCGMSEEFCEKYPFIGSLDEICVEVGLWRQNIERYATQKTKYMVMQTVDVSVSYIYEGEANLTSDEVRQKFWDEGGYQTCPVVDVDMLDWEKPWDAFKYDEPTKPLTPEQIRTALSNLIPEISQGAKS